MREHDYLYHYGVLGMHWGVRKDNNAYKKKHDKKVARLEKLKKEEDDDWAAAQKNFGKKGSLSKYYTEQQVAEMRKATSDTYDQMIAKANAKYQKQITKVQKHPDSEDAETVKEIRQKRLNEMSNEELRQVTQRLQLETQYKQMTSKRIAFGKRYAASMMGQTEAEVRRQATKKIATEIIKTAILI